MPTLLHPSTDRLQRYADAEPGPRVADHVARCWRCRARVVRLRALRDALQRFPVPEPPGDLLERILASRAAGARTILPVAREPGRGFTYARAAAVAVVVAGVAWGSVSLFGPRSSAPASWPPRFDEVTLLPPAAFGQEPRPRAAGPRYQLITVVDPTRVHAGQWTYEALSITDGVFTSPQGQRTITVADESYGSRPAWVTRESHGDFGDTVFVDRHSLRPMLHQRSSRGSFAFTQEFSGDSVFELLRVSRPEQKAFQGSAALPGPGGSPLAVSWSAYSIAAPLLLQAVPLERAWRGSLYSVNWVSRADRFPPITPVDLRVIGAQRITVPAGTFDCWKVEARQGESAWLLWVSKDRQWVVKSQYRNAPDWVTERVLVSATGGLTPPAP